MKIRYIGTSTPTAGIILVESIQRSRSLVRLVGANAHFFDDAGSAGAHTVRAVTSPVNTASIAFHRALGFAVSPVEPDYDGPGHDRVCFTRTVAER